MKLAPFLVCSALIAWMFSCTSNEPASSTANQLSDSAGAFQKTDAKLSRNARSREGDSVWIFLTYVKADKREQFEKFVHEIFYDSATRLSAEEQKVFAQTRVIHPGEVQKDGSLVYMFMMDPVIPGADYQIPGLLAKIYGKEKAAEYEKIFNDCLAKEQVGFSGVQSRH